MSASDGSERAPGVSGSLKQAGRDERLGTSRSGHEVLVFVTRGGPTARNVLLLRRVPSLGGYWHAITGSIEIGETEEEAALRELREESGLEGVAAAPDRFVYAYPLAEEPPERAALYPPGMTSVAVTCFRVEAPERWEPVLNREHDEYRWCTETEARLLIRWPIVKQALATLVSCPTN